jgi:protein-S-isoprenylcysteine O-methyltransferase Ste14
MINTPLPFMMPFAAVFWVAYFWAFFVSEWKIIKRAYADRSQGTFHQDSHFESPKFVMPLAQLIAFAVAFIEPLQFGISNPYVLFWIGITMLIGASVLRRHCFRMLGEYFTFDVRVHDEQPVIERGAYSWVRHPSYTAGILMFIGVGFALGNWVSLVILSTIAVFVYMKRIAVEERALEETLGERYRTYMQSRKRLIPYVY